jgi:hypothetical protein
MFYSKLIIGEFIYWCHIAEWQLVLAEKGLALLFNVVAKEEKKVAAWKTEHVVVSKQLEKWFTCSLLNSWWDCFESQEQL